MTCTDEDPNDNEGYAEFLNECAKHCRCCTCCQMNPCPGTMAGGLCDGMTCRHDEEPTSERDPLEWEEWE